MRILHVIPWLAPRYGGPATFVPQATRAVTALGHHAEIVTTNANGSGVLDVPTGCLTDWAGAAATFHSVSMPRWYVTSWPMLADLKRRALEFDVIHIHCLYRFHGVAAAVVARSQGIPYVVQAHGSLDPWHRNHRRRAKGLYHALVEDSILHGASAVLCTSRREERSIRDLGYTVPTWVIPIGIDADDLRMLGTSDTAFAQDLAEEVRVVTFLGRISAKKGVPVLVDAFRGIAAAFPLAHLVIAGPDDEGIGRHLMPMIASTGLTDRISFPGILGGRDKRWLLQRSDVLVLASADESFGMTVAEAMAVGCPVVVSPDVAIQEMVRSSGAGIVTERNAAAIADAVATILANPSRASSMGAAGKRVVDERFKWPVVAGQMEAMYQAIVMTAHRSRRRNDAIPQVPRAYAPTAPSLACPVCHGGLRLADAGGLCERCGWTCNRVSGVAILVPDMAVIKHDDLNHHLAHGNKGEQSAHYDQSDDEDFEISRPHGTPRLYRFLIGEKFRRAVSPIRPHLVGATALSVCGGSGMDAEFLARAGAAVTTSDLSLGAATRAKSRSKRHRLRFRSIVADVEHLPYADKSVDLVAVHDGLHHLDDPYVGLSEMARVARRWVVVTEPARASITRLAVRVGLALETEEAGNRVARMEPSEVAAYLETRGFKVLLAERYAMYYHHRPGSAFRLLSRPFVFPIVRTCWRLANTLVGRFGNKMVVVAERAM